MDSLNKLFTFLGRVLGNDKSQPSSKRFAFLLNVPIVPVITILFANKLINLKEFELAKDLITSYFIFVLILGGYVTVELIVKIIEIIKGKNVK